MWVLRFICFISMKANLSTLDDVFLSRKQSGNLVSEKPTCPPTTNLQMHFCPFSAGKSSVQIRKELTTQDLDESRTTIRLSKRPRSTGHSRTSSHPNHRGGQNVVGKWNVEAHMVFCSHHWVRFFKLFQFECEIGKRERGRVGDDWPKVVLLFFTASCLVSLEDPFQRLTYIGLESWPS